MWISIARSFTPPILWKALGRFIAKFKGLPTYEAKVYSSVESCPTIVMDAWSSPFWLKHVETDGKEALRHSSKELNLHHSSLLTAILASLPLTRHKQVSVLDFGGGVGLYFRLVQGALNSLGVGTRYAVVDGPSSCAVGREMNKHHANLQFFNSQEEGIKHAHDFLGSVDVCNIASTLHYIVDWRRTLEEIIKFQPSLIVISRAPTPDMAVQEGYVTQHITTKYGYCGAARVVLIPAVELTDAMSSLGYTLLMEQGWTGDANWYWEAGCTSTKYRQLTNRAFIFIKQHG